MSMLGDYKGHEDYKINPSYECKKDKSVEMMVNPLNYNSVEAENKEKATLSDKKGARPSTSDSKKTNRNSSRRRKKKKKKKTCFSSVLEILKKMNPVARHLEIAQAEISSYLGSERFLIEPSTLKFSDKKEEKKFIRQWRGFGTLRLFCVLVAAMMNVKYISIYRQALRGYETLAMLTSFLPCVFSIILLVMSKKCKSLLFRHYDTAVGWFVVLFSATISVQNMLQRVLATEYFPFSPICRSFYISITVKGLLWFSATGLTLRFKSAVKFVTFGALFELVALHIQPGRVLTVLNVIRALWSLGITTAFSIYSSYQLELQARRNFAIGNDDWRDKRKQKLFFQSKHKTCCGRSFCLLISDPVLARKYWIFEQGRHAAYTMKKGLSTIFISVIGVVSFLIFSIPDYSGDQAPPLRNLYTSSVMLIFIVSIPALLIMLVLDAILMKKFSKLGDSRFSKIFLFCILPALFGIGWTLSVEHTRHTGLNLYNIHTKNESCACRSCSDCWSHLKNLKMNQREWTQLHNTLEADPKSTNFKGAKLDELLCRVGGVSPSNSTDNCKPEIKFVVPFCNSFYPKTYQIWVLQSITLLSSSQVHVGGSAILIVFIARILSEILYYPYWNIITLIQLLWGDGAFYICAILAIREVEKNQQGYFFALQRRRKSFAEIFRSGDNLEETTGSNPPAAVEVEEEEQK